MIPKVKTATAFRKEMYETLKWVAQESEIVLVTQKEGENVVLISQDEYNKIIGEREVLRAISEGVTALDEGRSLSHKEALARLKKLQAKWK
jgi:PHD/YefM family antitoxin component YafN of YafNO toxin-antitoxin module